MSRLRRLLDRVELTSVRAALEFVDDRGHRDAAQIAYFALLSFIRSRSSWWGPSASSSTTRTSARGS